MKYEIHPDIVANEYRSRKLLERIIKIQKNTIKKVVTK